MLPSTEYLNNILINGYLTHSFPGAEKEYIQDYGFDYFDKLPKSKKNKLQIVRDELVKLESALGRCSYLKERHHKNNKKIVNKELFMTFPGAKTIFYSQFAPERLYKGPIDCSLFERFPLVVGESKKEYLMRIIDYETNIRNYNTGYMSKEEILQAANLVLNHYCEASSCISFIGIKDIINIPIYEKNYGQGFNRFNAYYEMMESGNYRIKDFFTNYMNDEPEFCDIGDLVTLSSLIDKKSISLVDFPDWYNLRQAFLKRIGVPEGSLVRYDNCTEIEKLDDIREEHIRLLYKKIK